MELIEKIVFPLFLIWAIGIFLLSFRKEIDYYYKITFLFIFVFYGFQFYPDLVKAYDRLEKNYTIEIVSWLYGFGKVTFYFLLILWPVSLVRIFYSASETLSRTLIHILISVTLLYWIGFFLYIKFETEVDLFFYGTFVRWITI
ncbi:MAG: hypothetical protein L6Q54_03400 [Leptospiraceae bacterium]|nr:hypothetical protein [Leptospiraceae bacterium]MCK6380283.1 hypothetical protein [Leptospiraceae bacterium]NUM42050.1 hypothetical protein [Leptospiraceae bacterium]